jgi:TonB-linked SusC/RagA family outer membrane protein
MYVCAMNRGLLLSARALIFLAFFLVSSIKASSQTISISVKDESLEQVFRLIEKQTGYYFTYTQEQIAAAPRISLDIQGKSIGEVLNICLRGLPLTYEISGREIILKEKPGNSPGPGPAAGGREIMVTGRIIDDSDRTPLAGAIIRIKGTPLGTVSDKDGVFTLGGISEQTVLVFSFVSYLSLEEKAGSLLLHRGMADTLWIGLEREQRKLDSIVINTGLYRRPVGNFTGAAATMSGEELKMINPASTIKALSVMDPSFRITENNVMGSNPNSLPAIQLRGANNLPVTLQGGAGSQAIPSPVSQGDIMGSYLSNPNQPLIIIDGFQSTLQALYDLNIDRIERVTLLKDAAATVAYGSKAANGVIVVETKRPVSGRLQVSYSVNMNLSAPDLSSYHLLDAKGLLMAQQIAGIYTDPNGNQANNVALQQWYDERLYQVRRGVNTDWLAQPVRNGLGSSHNLDLSGGNNHVRFGLDLSYTNTEGVMKGSSRTTYALNNYLGYVAGRLKLSNNATVTYGSSKNSPWGSFATYAGQFPYFSPYDSTGHVAKILEPRAAALGIPIPAPGGIFTNAMYNSTLHVKDYSNYLSFDDAVNVEYVLLPSLRLSGGLHIVNQLPGAEQYLPADHTSFVGSLATGIGDLGSYTQIRGRNTVMDSRIGLDYNKRFGDHTLFVSVGGTAQSTSSSSTSVTANGIPNDNLSQLGMANGYNAADIKPAEGMNRTRSLSMYASASYTYTERYTAEVTGNASGSSQFGSNNRIAPFFAYGMGWNIDKERFFPTCGWVQQLRLRVSYGVTGNQNFAAFFGQPVYQYNTSNNYRLQLGTYLQGYANPDLKWQQTDKWNIGLTTSLLNNRVNINGNYFIEHTDNLILPLGIAPSTGFSAYMDNLGATTNRGYEVTISAVVIRDQRKHLFWSLNFNTGHFTNTIRSLSPAIIAYNNANDANGVDQTTPLPRYQVGQSMTRIWAVPSLGIDPATGNELFRKLDGTTTFVWSAADKRPVGDETSRFKGAFGSNLLYKGIVLNIQMSFEYGGQLYNQTLEDRVENVSLLSTNADSRVLTDRWKQPGDHAAFKALSNTSSTNATSRFVQDNNYLNASSITVGYNFSPTAVWVQKMHLSAPRLFVTQNDVFRLSALGLERGTSYPFARSYSLGLSTAF